MFSYFGKPELNCLAEEKMDQNSFFLPKNCAKIAKPAVTLRPNSHQVQQKEEIAIT